jgi:hypothetical protein
VFAGMLTLTLMALTQFFGDGDGSEFPDWGSD